MCKALKVQPGPAIGCLLLLTVLSCQAISGFAMYSMSRVHEALTICIVVRTKVNDFGGSNSVPHSQQLMVSLSFDYIDQRPVSKTLQSQSLTCSVHFHKFSITVAACDFLDLGVDVNTKLVYHVSYELNDFKAQTLLVQSQYHARGVESNIGLLKVWKYFKMRWCHKHDLARWRALWKENEASNEVRRRFQIFDRNNIGEFSPDEIRGKVHFLFCEIGLIDKETGAIFEVPKIDGGVLAA
ncbi:hypothetical protein IW262DRAFT_1291171 [Armillaria fumosa]|nr:hypothetical protein IW262DRAFT_1291171 [Armillaria fumosa]